MAGAQHGTAWYMLINLSCFQSRTEA